MDRLKTYKYRIYPNLDQRQRLAQHFGSCRFIYNHCLSRKIQEYTVNGISLSKYDLMKEVTQLKKTSEYSWLKLVNAQSLQSAVEHLDSAYTQFFRKGYGFPKFKSKKHNHNSCAFRQDSKVDFNKNRLFLMKFRDGIKCKFSRQFDGEIRTVTIKQVPSGKYFACILVNEPVPDIIKSPLEYDKAVGIDVGIKTFATISNGVKIDNPKFFRKSQKKLAKLQRSLSRKKKGSNNRNKQRIKVARQHERITNQRLDFLHKLTRQLVDDNQVTTFCLETLNVQGMIKNRKLSKSIADASCSKFVQILTYKSEWVGKNILHIGRFEPSSKTCNVCGLINTNLKLSDREWVCECGTKHVRDLLAACNIKHFAFSDQNLIGQTLSEFTPAESGRCKDTRRSRKSAKSLI